MSNDTPTILEDDRPIYAVYEGQDRYCAEGYYDEIKVYAENGQMARVPYVAICKDGAIRLRIPAHKVMIQYYDE